MQQREGLAHRQIRARLLLHFKTSFREDVSGEPQSVVCSMWAVHMNVHAIAAGSKKRRRIRQSSHAHRGSESTNRAADDFGVSRFFRKRLQVHAHCPKESKPTDE